jgi:hypothetical protein
VLLNIMKLYNSRQCYTCALMSVNSDSIEHMKYVCRFSVLSNCISYVEIFDTAFPVRICKV